MKHIFITGMSGTGKSTLAFALRKIGLNAIDLDKHPDLCWMYYKDSGKPVETEFNNHNLTWCKSVEWLYNKKALVTFLKNQPNPTYCLGTGDNLTDILPLFGICFVLHLDELTHRKRLSERNDDNNWAKTKDVQDWLMEQRGSYEEKAKDFGAMFIDATQSVEDLISEIIVKSQ